MHGPEATSMGIIPACLNPLTTDDECTHHVTLPACYHLALKFLVGVVLHNQAVEDNMGSLS